MSFAEIQNLKSNLETSQRGQSIQALKEKIISLIAASNWEEAEAFFSSYSETFEAEGPVLGIINKEFQQYFDSVLESEKFEAVVLSERLRSYSWFQGVREQEYKSGKISERLANFAQGIVRLVKLQDARTHYRSANKREDASRVQKMLSEEVRKIDFGAPIEIPIDAPPTVKLNEMLETNLKGWLATSFQKRLGLLVNDFSGIRPATFRPAQTDSGDIFSSGLFEALGVIRPIGISPEDGRVNAGQMASAPERIQNESYNIVLISFLKAFVGPLFEWLKEKNEDYLMYQEVGGVLADQLEWEKDTIETFMEGLTSWLSEKPHVSLAFWIPLFENVLRKKMGDLGEDIVNPQDRPGIENFVLFDGLLTKSSRYFDEETVNYWRNLYSTRNGLGWNLRNSFCHGLLSVNQLKKPVLAFAVLLSFLFLLNPKSENGNAD